MKSVSADMAIARLVEATLFLACLTLIAQRYRRRQIWLVPGDMLLWTLVVFFVVHLPLGALDIRPKYNIYPRFDDGYDDALVRVLAGVTVFVAVLVTVAVIRIAERREFKSASQQRAFPKLYLRWWLAGAFLPLFVVLLAPAPGAYRTFAAAFVRRGPGQQFADPTSAASQFHILLTWSTYLSCVSFAVWFSIRGRAGRRPWMWALAALVCFMDIWLNGKRHIVAIFVIVLLFAMLNNHALTQSQVRRGLFRMAAGVVAVLAFSSWYQATYRPFVAERGNQSEALLIDFGRLDVVRFALAGHTNLDVARPLDYAGESALLTVRALQRDPENVTYPDRVTALGRDHPRTPQPGAVTTSLISEAIDNFGPLGILIGPLLLALLALLASYQNDPLLRVVGGLAVAMLAVVHILAVLSLVLVLGARFGLLMMRRVVRSSIRSPTFHVTRASTGVRPSTRGTAPRVNS